MTEAELMLGIEQGLEGLDAAARARVLTWISSRWASQMEERIERIESSSPLAVFGTPLTSSNPFEDERRAAEFRSGVLEGGENEAVVAEADARLAHLRAQGVLAHLEYLVRQAVAVVEWQDELKSLLAEAPLHPEEVRSILSSYSYEVLHPFSDPLVDASEQCQLLWNLLHEKFPISASVGP